MGGPAKTRHPTDAKGPNSSKGSSSASRDPTQRSIPRLDGNRDPTMSGVQSYTRPMDLKNLSEFLGVSGWYTARGESIPQALPQRPKAFNSNGREAVIKLNTFNVLKSPSTVVYQYDVAFRGDANDYSKRALISKIWHSKAVKQALGEPGERWIYDYNKLAWSTKRLEREDETRIKVDLDAEEKRTTKPGARGNSHTVILRCTRKVDFSGLESFLAGRASWSEQCIDTINFLDHLMREGPTQHYTQIKKSFFQRGQQRFDLGGGVEAFKGVFASLRPVLNDNFQKSLAVNVDVANGTFWRAQELGRAILQVFNFSSPAQLAQHFKQAKTQWKNSLMKKDLRTLRRVGVVTTHLSDPVRWVIDEFVDKDVDEATFTRDGKKISLAQYFREQYKINCLKGVPVVKMTKKIRGENVYLPVDVLKIEENQRYNSKLSDRQTSEMIKFAVTLPQKRWEAVQAGVQLLNWKNDPYLKHYGLQISTQESRVKGRILPPPTVSFGQGSKEATIKPMDLQNGRWRLDGRKFAMNNSQRPIKAWGVCCIQGRGAPPPPAVEAFVQKFVQVYESHGGHISSHPQHGKKPWIGPGNLSDGGELVSKVWNQTGNRYNTQPNLLLFIVTDRNVDVYRRIKKSCDIRFGIASQVMQAKHVMTASPQYISNVCMKVNAKLGGATTVVRSNVIPKVAPKSGAIPTMVVGADVSHPAPGAGSGDAASFAAITVSADVNYARYWAEVQTNGHRIEMVTSANIDNHFGNMAKLWIQRIGQGQPPKRVLYLRDGVSEGQYQQVLEEEVRDMKECFKKLGCKEVPKFTVVISGKRHHIRFFPEKGDRNGNPLPGTLVESGCTHPFEFDFYLCSHVAIKGTARPIHYHCILNEGEWHAQELQSFIFDHAFQYIRSTTPVSQHPAVYYAHLAADRARAHVNDSPISSGKKESKAEQQTTTGSSSNNIQVPPLMPMLNSRGLKEVMWYI